MAQKMYDLISKEKRTKEQKKLFISKLLIHSYNIGANDTMAQVTFVGIACYWLWDI
jgi:hypothetical protein